MWSVLLVGVGVGIVGVGVDIMNTREPMNGESKYADVLRGCFTEQERMFIYGLEDDGETGGHEMPKIQWCRFFMLWCLKESYLKALGCGLGAAQDENQHPIDILFLEFTISPPHVHRRTPINCHLSIRKQPQLHWLFQLQFIDFEHVTACSLRFKHAKDVPSVFNCIPHSIYRNDNSSASITKG